MSSSPNIAETIERVARKFEAAGLHYGHGTATARDEAAWLVLHVLRAPLDGGFDDWDRRPSHEERAEVERLATLRCESHQPLAYLLGEAWFAGLPFEVSPDVLVPRSPIAELVLEGFRPWALPHEGGRVLDLCTGSGCIGIATALCRPDCRVDLADISPAALEVARRNIERHGLRDRVRCYESDLFASLPAVGYDLIVSNPPYVPAGEVNRLPDEYRAEPRLGLESGGDGLDAPLAILLDAPRFLCEDGVLICEVGESEERLASLLPGLPFLWLEFRHGGSGVFVLTRDELNEAAPIIAAAAGKRTHVT